ncbi:hypothetical protein BKA70DRAFT_1420520 [Coprinopsis sp. MPI-PUGE-AT-0042]|nr:hypothetical protein BKA70DRAFT_1420520 [Coprinopsis sp. MPI-PUGE-AT-0042]
MARRFSAKQGMLIKGCLHTIIYSISSLESSEMASEIGFFSNSVNYGLHDKEVPIDEQLKIAKSKLAARKAQRAAGMAALEASISPEGRGLSTSLPPLPAATVVEPKRCQSQPLLQSGSSSTFGDAKNNADALPLRPSEAQVPNDPYPYPQRRASLPSPQLPPLNDPSESQRSKLRIESNVVPMRSDEGINLGSPESPTTAEASKLGPKPASSWYSKVMKKKKVQRTPSESVPEGKKS